VLRAVFRSRNFSLAIRIIARKTLRIFWEQHADVYSVVYIRFIGSHQEYKVDATTL
jgi:mRNA-degrading endonuclease HigB of HigAB toxin-antitoxin module